MKSIVLKVYYFTLAGATAGLLAWYFYSLLDQATSLSLREHRLLEAAVLGVLLGAFLGFALNVVDGILFRSFKRFINGALVGTLSGIIGGGLGLCVADRVYTWLSPNHSQGHLNLLAIILGWIIFGAILGFAQGLAGDTRPIKATVGGAIGGILAGLVYSQVGPASAKIAFLLALLAIGSLIALALSIAASLQEAWLEVQVKGFLQDRRFDLSKAIRQPGNALIIGRGKGCNLPLPQEPKVQPRHASLTREGEQFILRKLEGEVYINHRSIQAHQLKDMERFLIGSTTLVYREKRGAKPKKKSPIRVL